MVEDLEEEHAEAAIAMSSAEEEAFMMAEDGDEEVAAENESVAVKPAAETKVAAPLVVGNEATYFSINASSFSISKFPLYVNTKSPGLAKRSK